MLLPQFIFKALITCLRFVFRTAVVVKELTLDAVGFRREQRYFAQSDYKAQKSLGGKALEARNFHMKNWGGGEMYWYISAGFQIAEGGHNSR